MKPIGTSTIEGNELDASVVNTLRPEKGRRLLRASSLRRPRGAA